GVSQYSGGDLQQVALQRRTVRFRQFQARAQWTMVRQQTLQLEVERGRVRKIGDTDGATSYLVFVSRADAAPCGADLRIARRLFARRVDISVPGQDQHGVVRHDQVVRLQHDALLRHL